mmetsp:Transcript_3460/g.13716  ORF Transcript_3460/g.13716 Transcript_3460/m.13716 type:complete len:239 (-) Transcript_3460:4-720(-)
MLHEVLCQGRGSSADLSLLPFVPQRDSTEVIGSGVLQRLHDSLLHRRAGLHLLAIVLLLISIQDLRERAGFLRPQRAGRVGGKRAAFSVVVGGEIFAQDVPLRDALRSTGFLERLLLRHSPVLEALQQLAQRIYRDDLRDAVLVLHSALLHPAARTHFLFPHFLHRSPPQAIAEEVLLEPGVQEGVLLGHRFVRDGRLVAHGASLRRWAARSDSLSVSLFRILSDISLSWWRNTASLT